MQWLTTRNKKSDTRVQIPVKFRYIHFRVNTVGKCINHPAMGEIVGQTGLFGLGGGNQSRTL